MISTRMCSKLDKDNAKKMWKYIFQDSDSFTDWFFDNRFYPDYSVCTYDNESLISILHSMPMNLVINNQNILSTMVCGVSTLEKYRKKGYMHSSFSLHTKQMREKGIVLSTLKAVHMPTYYPFGYFGATKSAVMSVKKTHNDTSIPNSLNTKHVDLKDEKTLFDLGACYDLFTTKHNCIAKRDSFEFKRKMNEYLSDNAKCIAYYYEGFIEGYAIYFDEDELFVEEFCANSEQAAHALVAGFCKCDKKVSIKTSVSVSGYFDDLDVGIHEQNSMRVINVQKFLEYTWKTKDYVIKVKDEFVPDNNGTFFSDGTLTNRPHNIETDSFSLLSLISGYNTIDHLIQSGSVKISDASIVSEISKTFKKTDCFIFDEY